MSDSHDLERWCYTKDKKVSGRFVWKIEDFTYRTKRLISSVFPASGPNSRVWSLILDPVGIDESGKSFIYVYIRHERSMEIWVNAKFSLINNKDTVARSLEVRWRKLSDGWGFHKFIERDYVLNEDNGVLPNGVLTIVFDIEMREEPKNRLEFVHAKFEPPLCRLSEDMGNLLSSKSLTDLTITVGERQFRAHKAILAARSPVVAAMFRNGMAETKFSKVKITDIDPDVFQELLEYIYTGNEISHTRKTKKLLAAANKYELERLKVMCEKVLCNELSLDNVLEYIALADCCNASYLKEYSMHFALKNRNDLMGISSWDSFKFSHQNLVVEMFEKISI